MKYSTHLTVNLLTLFVFLTNFLFSQVSFPLYQIDVKINKPNNYYLLTPEQINQVKDDILENSEVCEIYKTTFNLSLANPKYQILCNKINVNEFITFVKFPKINIDNTLIENIQDIVKTNCITYYGNSFSLNLLSQDNGTAQLGRYKSFLYKVRGLEFEHFSEAYFIESRNSTILVTINSFDKKDNFGFIKSIQYLSSRPYEDLMNEADLLFSEEKFGELQMVLGKAISLNPRNLLAYKKRIALNVKLKKHRKILDDANRIIEFEKSNLYALLTRIYANYYLQNYELVIEEFSKALILYFILSENNLLNSLDISFCLIYDLMGDLYSKIGNSEKAIEHYNISLELALDSTTRASLYYDIGVVNSSLKNDSRTAITYYTKSIENASKKDKEIGSKAYFNRGINNRKLEKYQFALSDYTQAIIINPSYAKAYINRGIVKYIIEDYLGGINDFTQAINIDGYSTSLSRLALYHRGFSKLILEDETGCKDLLTAEKLGETIPEELLKLCK